MSSERNHVSAAVGHGLFHSLSTALGLSRSRGSLEEPLLRPSSADRLSSAEGAGAPPQIIKTCQTPSTNIVANRVEAPTNEIRPSPPLLASACTNWQSSIPCLPAESAVPDVQSGADKHKLAVNPCEMGSEDVPWAPSAERTCRMTVLVYGTGHFMNDLTSACWFTYLLIFLTDIGLSPGCAGLVMMSGQVADALATLMGGRLMDAFGHLKLWHLGGSVCTVLSFSSVFRGCLFCTSSDLGATLPPALSYSFFAAVFNVGWALTQVSHMAMVNCMTCNPSSQVALNSCRNAFSMVANLTLYGIAFLAFWFLPSDSPEALKRQYRYIAAGALSIGIIFVVIFQLGIQEPRPRKAMKRSGGTHRGAHLYWFKQLRYYQVAAIYTLTRLVCNVSQAILPFFIVRDLDMHQSAKAVVPAVMFVFSFLVSVVLQEMQWSALRLKLSFTLGSLLWALTGILIFFLDYGQQQFLYGIAALMGAASALTLVSATSMEGALVGLRVNGCAFVYGSLSFLDKITSGVALLAIESANVATPFCGSIGPKCPRSLVRWVLTLIPLLCCAVATFIAILTDFHESESLLDLPLISNDNVSPGAAECFPAVSEGQRGSMPMLKERLYRRDSCADV